MRFPWLGSTGMDTVTTVPPPGSGRRVGPQDASVRHSSRRGQDLASVNEPGVALGNGDAQPDVGRSVSSSDTPPERSTGIWPDRSA